jgi:hypothetical protein
MKKCNICNRPKGSSIGYCLSGQGEGFTKGQYLRDCLEVSRSFLYQEKHAIELRYGVALGKIQNEIDYVNELIKESF